MREEDEDEEAAEVREGRAAREAVREGTALQRVHVLPEQGHELGTVLRTRQDSEGEVPAAADAQEVRQVHAMK